jgi:carboxyl-terminal processing protease
MLSLPPANQKSSAHEDSAMARLGTPVRFAFVLTVGVVAGLSLSLGRPVQAERKVEPEPNSQSVADTTVTAPVPWKDARLLAEVLEHVRREYVERISDQELIEAAIRGMIADLDPHSAFLDPEQFDEIRISTTGEYSGVGIEVALENGVVKVVNPIEDTPAFRAGVLAGDRILAVDDVPVDAENLNDTIDRMRGRVGTPVKISIARGPDPKPMEFTLARAAVQVHSVTQNLLEPGLGYVKISHFSETTTPDLERAIAKLKKTSGGALRGLVLDLRNNPGGVLEAAVDVSDVFLDGGLIVTANGRAPDAQFSMDAQPGDDLNGAPLIVLVNGGSASASEIVAGALQDHHRARLVGSQTYGKGSVQTVMALSDGHAIKLTTSKYFTPSGASIHQRGIKPDVAVEDTKDGDDRALHVALDLLKNPGTIRQSSAD